MDSRLLKLERDGWYAGEIHEAVYAMGGCREQLGERPDPLTGLWDLVPPAIHRRLPSRRGWRRHGGSETEPTLDAVPPVMGCFTPGLMWRTLIRAQ